MDTIYEKTDAKNPDESVIKKAGSIIKRGGLVAFPTETVYGLGADALCADSSKKVYAAKGRPSDNPLIVHIAKIEDLDVIASYVPEKARILADAFWPGPLTMIFQKKPIVPSEVTGGLDTVAVRFPSHPVAKAFIEEAGGFIAAPSANVSGRPSPTTGEHVYSDMNGRIDMIIDSGPCTIGLESTIIDMTGDIPELLRPGYIDPKMLREAVGDIAIDPAVKGEADEGTAPKAPGMKYRHYAPKGEVIIISGSEEAVRSHIEKMIEKNRGVKKTAVICRTENVRFFSGADYTADAGADEDEDKIASRLYDILRRCDEENIDVIYSEEFDTPRLGLAIMNRLIKAAGHRIEKV